MDLFELITHSGEQNKFDYINYRFERYINFLVKSFNLELYKNDLLLFLWQLTKKIDTNNFDSEKALYAYICTCLKNHCINIYRKDKTANKMTYNSEVTEIEIDKQIFSSISDNSNLFFDDLITFLPDSQKKILNMRYKYCLSDAEIASELKMSRQAVHKSRCSALNKLQKYHLSN